MKKAISLKLKMSEIIFDIQNKTYLTGRSVSTGSNQAHVANMQANEDDENSAQILRSITMAYSILRNRLSDFLQGEEVSAGNDILSGESDLVVPLSMPSNFNTGVAQSIADAAHQFIVAYAVAEWFAITAKGETTDYSAVADASLAALEEAICKRSRPIRNA